jgi:hypothetical protein
MGKSLLTIFDNSGKAIPGLNLVHYPHNTCGGVEVWVQFPWYRHQIEVSGQLHTFPASLPHPLPVPNGCKARLAGRRVISSVSVKSHLGIYVSKLKLSV